MYKLLFDAGDPGPAAAACEAVGRFTEQHVAVETRLTLQSSSSAKLEVPFMRVNFTVYLHILHTFNNVFEACA